MPQSSFALRRKATILSALRNPPYVVHTTGSVSVGTRPVRPLWARKPFTCSHGQLVALDIRDGILWVLWTCPEQPQRWLPLAEALGQDECRRWRRDGFC